MNDIIPFLFLVLTTISIVIPMFLVYKEDKKDEFKKKEEIFSSLYKNNENEDEQVKRIKNSLRELVTEFKKSQRNF